MVISHKMIVREMGYRGSKFQMKWIKEQRVDGTGYKVKFYI